MKGWRLLIVAASAAAALAVGLTAPTAGAHAPLQQAQAGEDAPVS